MSGSQELHLTTKNEQLKLPEPGQYEVLKNPPEGYAGVIKGIAANRYAVKLVKSPPGKK